MWSKNTQSTIGLDERISRTNWTLSPLSRYWAKLESRLGKESLAHLTQSASLMFFSLFWTFDSSRGSTKMEKERLCLLLSSYALSHLQSLFLSLSMRRGVEKMRMRGEGKSSGRMQFTRAHNTNCHQFSTFLALVLTTNVAGFNFVPSPSSSCLSSARSVSCWL